MSLEFEVSDLAELGMLEDFVTRDASVVGADVSVSVLLSEYVVLNLETSISSSTTCEP